MVNVTQHSSARIDRTLSAQLAAWNELPEVVTEIEQWDRVDQVDYIEEWTRRLQLLDVIRGYARDGRSNPEQQSLYSDLETRVSQHKALLKALRRS